LTPPFVGSNPATPVLHRLAPILIIFRFYGRCCIEERAKSLFKKKKL